MRIRRIRIATRPRCDDALKQSLSAASPVARTATTPRHGAPGRAKKPTTTARFTGVPEAGMTIAGSQRLTRRHRGFLRSCVVDRTGFRRPAVAMPSRCKRRGYRSMRSVWWQRGNPRVADCRRSMPSARCAGSRPRNAMAAEAKRSRRSARSPSQARRIGSPLRVGHGLSRLKECRGKSVAAHAPPQARGEQ